jgi:hypothetical protein
MEAAGSLFSGYSFPFVPLVSGKRRLDSAVGRAKPVLVRLFKEAAGKARALSPKSL